MDDVRSQLLNLAAACHELAHGVEGMAQGEAEPSIDDSVVMLTAFREIHLGAIRVIGAIGPGTLADALLRLPT